jgi:hypothetical protein
MFKIMKAWAGLLGDTTFSDEDELVIKYPKPKILISDKETLENIEKRLNMGLMEDWEALVAIDPNLTEAEARQKIEVIRTQRIERLPFGYNKESNPESQGRSEGEMGESEEGSR